VNLSDFKEDPETEKRAVQAVMSDQWPPPGPMQGPLQNPLDRYAHLPETTRRWLESLDEDDVKEIKEAIRFQRSAKTIGTFGKWLLVTAVSVFIAAVTFGEKVGIAWKWLTGGGK
jgi:hypothetical protein